MRNNDDDRTEEPEDTAVPDGADSPHEDEEARAPEEAPPHQQVGYPFETPHAMGGPGTVPVYDPEGEDEALEPEREPPRAATYVAFGIVIMAALGVLMTAAAIKMHFERAEMSDVLEEAVHRIETVYAGPQAPDTARRRVAWLKRSLDESDYAQAQKALEALGQPDAGRPTFGRDRDRRDDPRTDELRPDLLEGPDGRQLPSPSEMEDLPPEVQRFFEGEEKLWEAFLGFSAAVVQLERAGADVRGLKRVRGSVVEAARLGQVARVETLLTEARQKVEEVGPKRVPESLEGKIGQFRDGLERARTEGRDLRAVMQLAQSSEEAARDGDFERAEDLMDRALEALKRAPRMQRRAPMTGMPAPDGRGPMIGPEFAFTRFIAQLAGQVMQAEQEDLGRVWESINIAAGAIRERNADQIREILGDAKTALQDIGQRRREMTASIDEARQSIQQERPPRRGEAEAAADAEQERRREIVTARVSDLLGQIRSIPQEEFERRRAEIAGQVLAAVTAPVPPLESEREEPEMTPEKRVRAKMRIAGEMYLQIKQKTDLDTWELDEHFEEIRRLIAKHEYERAEEMVDEGVAMMQRMLGEARSRAETAPERAPGAVSPPGAELDGLEIDLRGIVDDRPSVTPPPALQTTPGLPGGSDLTDTAETGDEQ